MDFGDSMNQRLGRCGNGSRSFARLPGQCLQHLLDNLRLQCRKVRLKRLRNGARDDLFDLAGLRFALFVVPFRHAGKPFAPGGVDARGTTPKTRGSNC
jgi:hypothetical protein